MNRVAAMVMSIAALLAIGAWSAFGERWTAGADPVAAQIAGQVADDAGPDDAGPDDAAPADGWTPVPFRSDEPVQSFEAAEPVLEPDLDYRARIETTAGTLVVDLYESRVPNTVNNFVFLALHRFYEDVPFHRVIEDFMAQTGDPTGTGSGGPGYRFDDEIVDGLVHDRAGLLSMANAGPDTNGSQFFVTFGPTPWLDGKHAVFGEVVEGLEVLDALTRVDPQTPSAVARLSDPVARLVEQGVEQAAGAEGTVGEWLEQSLGSLPGEGQSFQLEGRRGVLGSASGAPAVGLFPVPDRIERVTILTRPQEDPA